MKRELKARVCAICGRPGGTVALTVKWLREADPALAPFEGDYGHPACARAADAIGAAQKKRRA